MKKKALLVLLATMMLTVASVGTVFAMGDNGDVVGQNEPEQHVHTWGNEVYHKTADAVWSEPEWIVTKEEEKIEHEAVYGEPTWVIDVPAQYETQTICYLCAEQGIHTQFKNNAVVGTGQSAADHELEAHGGASHYGQENICIQEEQGHWQKGELISEAWTETIPEEGYWTESELITPEQGYWTHTCTVCNAVANVETGEIIEEGKLPTDPDVDPSEPTDPKDPSEPTNPTDPVKPSDPTETEKPETDNKENTATQEQENTDKKTDTETTTDKKAETDTTTESSENKAPKTGDASSMISLVTLIGSAVTGGTAFGLKRKFRK